MSRERNTWGRAGSVQSRDASVSKSSPDQTRPADRGPVLSTKAQSSLSGPTYAERQAALERMIARRENGDRTYRLLNAIYLARHSLLAMECGQ